MTNERYRRHFPISWEQLHRDGKALAWRLLERGTYKGIIAITRGGLVPAAVVARELDIHLIDTLCIVSYDWQDQSNTCQILKCAEGDGEGWLIIDDLVDTGKTMAEARKLMPKATIATLYAKPAGRDLVDVFITEVSQDTWILFPWDSEVQYVKPLVSME